MKKKIWIGFGSLIAVLLFAIVGCTKDSGSDNPSGGSSAIKPPTGVRAERSGSMIKVSWNSVSNASYYNLYRSSGSTSASSAGPYFFVSSSSSTYCYDEYPDHINYYKVTAVDYNNVESEMSSWTGYTFSK